MQKIPNFFGDIPEKSLVHIMHLMYTSFLIVCNNNGVNQQFE
jgi:hypothetical protein